MITLPLAVLLTFAAPAPSPCEQLPPTSTIADQFTCYKESGRKILVPGTGFIEGFDGPGCLTGVWADRIQVATCSPSSFDRRTVVVMFASIRAVEDVANAPYVTLRLVGERAQADCAVVRCVQYVPVPAPAPAPAPVPRGVATPRRAKP